MRIEKTEKLIVWLETNHPDRHFSLNEMKELLSIALAELAENNFRIYDGLPGSVIEALFEEMKSSGEYYRLDNKLKNFKLRFPENE
jgi:hypothetical protein